MEEQVATIITDLDLADRAYFAKDRKKVIQAKIDEALALLDTKPIDEVGKLFSTICSRNLRCCVWRQILKTACPFALLLI